MTCCDVAALPASPHPSIRTKLCVLSSHLLVQIAADSIQFLHGMATKRCVGTLGEADHMGKKVFMRADLNVLLDDSQKITDDTCIRAFIPTIKFLCEKGAKVIPIWL